MSYFICFNKFIIKYLESDCHAALLICSKLATSLRDYTMTPNCSWLDIIHEIKNFFQVSRNWDKDWRWSSYHRNWLWGIQFDLVCIWLYEFQASRWPFQFSWFFPFIWCYYHQMFPLVVWFNAFNLMQLELLIPTITFIVVVNITSTVTSPFWNSFEIRWYIFSLTPWLL